ncbi:TetR/AcrR family transcriptional regulator [Nocardiopsis valliformis]|uniref:TetR/AcrR family transcriptional regulator n=1 Tax=Nocardiopsis valliformis TaxID=239974 RepID=UPI00034B5B6F|nr:TetR/AcrR family transcriptional regulator [Nocardiopsis valliformis]
MPKIVDHEERRRELAEALWRVIVASGPQAVSIRSVAAEAGLSPGALRHYFQTREELLVFAMDLSEQRVIQRMREYSRTLDPDLPVIERVAGFAEQMLPLDEMRHAEFRAWEAAGALGEGDPRREERWTQQRGLYRRLVGALGGLPPLEDPEQEHSDPWLETWAEFLHTYVDGLAIQMMLASSQVPPETAKARLRAFLAHIESTRAAEGAG